MGTQQKKTGDPEMGARIKDARERANFKSVPAFVRSVKDRWPDLTAKKMGYWERGDRGVHSDDLKRLSRTLGESTEWLLHGVKPKCNTGADSAIPTVAPAVPSPGVISSSQGTDDKGQKSAVPAHGDGGDAMDQTVDGYERGETVQVTLQKAMSRVSMALLNFSEADKNRSGLMSEVRQMMELAGPRTVAGTASERRESESGDANQLSADAQAKTGGSRAAG